MPNNLDLDNYYERIMGKVLNYLSYGLRTEKEVTQRLGTYINKLSISQLDKDTLSQRIIFRLKDLGMIDDAKMTDSMIVTLSEATKPKSKNYIRNSLYKRGFDSAAIDTVLNSVSVEDEFEAAKADFEKKYRSQKDIQKVKKYLLGKGYRYDVIQNVLEENHLS